MSKKSLGDVTGASRDGKRLLTDCHALDTYEQAEWVSAKERLGDATVSKFIESESLEMIPHEDSGYFLGHLSIALQGGAAARLLHSFTHCPRHFALLDCMNVILGRSVNPQTHSFHVVDTAQSSRFFREDEGRLGRG
jgi:hypothetical protein